MGMNLDLFLDKHKVILSLVKDIQKNITSAITENSADIIASDINKLSSVLMMHLASEDKNLYPEALSSDSEELRRTAKEYIDEMGNLMKVFDDFHKNFNTKSKILDNVNDFTLQAQKVTLAIEKRITKEESGLYKML
ncbi:MAG: hemerythrin domain-containing protein [Treponema sp.]|nr:hemerythrin domain-containing protein [Treponema sp.]